MLLRVQIAPVFVGQAGQQAIAVGRATKNTVSRRRVSFGLPLFEQEAVGQAQDDIPCFPMVRHGVEFGRRGAAFGADLDQASRAPFARFQDGVPASRKITGVEFVFQGVG